MDLPRGRRILSERISDIAGVYGKIPGDFRGLIRIFMKYDGRLHNGDLLIDTGSIIGVSLDDLDKNTSVFGEEAFVEIKSKIPEAVGDVDLHVFSDTEMSLALRTNERRLLRPGFPIERFKELLASGDTKEAEKKPEEKPAEEARKAPGEDKKAAEAEAARKAEDSKKMAEEAKRKAESEAEKAAEAEEAKRKAAEEDKKAAEAKRAEEAKRKAAEEKKKAAESKLLEESKKQAESEAKKVMASTKKGEEEWMNELDKLDDEWEKLESEWKKLDSIKGLSIDSEDKKQGKEAQKPAPLSKEESDVLKSKPKLAKNIGFADKLRLLRFPRASNAVGLMDGSKTVEEIISDAGADAKAVVDLVIDLKKRGYIE